MTVTTTILLDINAGDDVNYNDVFVPFITNMTNTGKTDGVSVRTNSVDGTQKTIVRTWVDSASANEYLDLIQLWWDPISTQIS